MNLTRRSEELDQRPVDHWGPWSFTLKQGLFHGVVRLLNAELADLEDPSSGAMRPPNSDPSASRLSPCQGANLTPREREVCRVQVKEWVAIARRLDEAYPDLRGAMIAGRSHPDSLLPFIPGLLDHHTAHHPEETLRTYHLGDDIHFAFAGPVAAFTAYARLVEQIADAQLDLTGLGVFGRFSGLETVDRRNAPVAMLGILIAASGQQWPSLALQTDLVPFEHPAWTPLDPATAESLRIDGACGPDPQGRCFAQVIRQGIFAAVRSLLTITLTGLTDSAIEAQPRHATEADDSTGKPLQPTPPAKIPRKGRPRDQGKGARCRAAYIDACGREETPPAPSELAKRFGCSVSVASRAIKSFEDKRKSFAKEDAQNRRSGRS